MSEAKETKSLVISFIAGTGNMGSRLSRNHAMAGNPVIIGSRSAEKAATVAAEVNKQLEAAGSSNRVRGVTNEEAAAQGDVIFYCAMGSIEERAALLRSIAPHLKGKIVVDITNIGYLPSFTEKQWGQHSAVDESRAAIPDAGCTWAVAYKTTTWLSLDNGPKDQDGIPLDVFVACDDEKARKTVISLINATGFRGVDFGPLKLARVIELLGPTTFAEKTSPEGSDHMILGYMLKNNAAGDPYRSSWRFR